MAGYPAAGQVSLCANCDTRGCRSAHASSHTNPAKDEESERAVSPPAAEQTAPGWPSVPPAAMRLVLSPQASVLTPVRAATKASTKCCRQCGGISGEAAKLLCDGSQWGSASSFGRVPLQPGAPSFARGHMSALTRAISAARSRKGPQSLEAPTVRTLSR